MDDNNLNEKNDKDKNIKVNKSYKQTILIR